MSEKKNKNKKISADLFRQRWAHVKRKESQRCMVY